MSPRARERRSARVMPRDRAAFEGWRTPPTTEAADGQYHDAGFEGRVIRPSDADYEQARAVYNALIDRRPALIVRCAGPHDVARAIALRARARAPAGRSRRRPQRRGAGHLRRRAGDRPLRHERASTWTRAARTARVGGGCTLGELDRATHAHGLATPSGIISTTGVGGITLGGGLGYLTRSCGLSIDNLLAAEVVLADGEHVRASADEHPDLFWALRGGGGNFGVVTAFEFRLHEVEHRRSPGRRSGRSSSAPRCCRSTASSCPPPRASCTASSPSPRCRRATRSRPRSTCARCAGSSGTTAARRRPRRATMAPLLDALPEPLLHGVQPVPHPAMQSAFDALYPEGDQWYWRADFVKEIPDAAVDLHARFGSELPTIKSTMHLYPIDGAAHDVAAGGHGVELPRRDLGHGLRRRRPGPGQRRPHPRLDRRLPGGAAPVLGGRRLREHDDGGGPRPGARELPRQLRPPGRASRPSTTPTTPSASTRTSRRVLSSGH